MRTPILFAVFAGLVWLLAVWLPPRMAVAVVPEGFNDMSGYRLSERYAYDPLASPRVGDPVVLRPGEEPAFARVAALPGDEVRISGGRLQVNGRDAEGQAPAGLPAKDLGPVLVPDGHLWLVSTGHRHDSFAHGPIARSLVLGVVRNPP